jgi:hypothetical protein
LIESKNNDNFYENSKNVPDLDEYKCPLCCTDLNVFNEFDKEKHVNECLDNSLNYEIMQKPTEIFETEKLEKKNVIENSNFSSNSANNIIKLQNQLILKDIIPNCPICGKILHSLNVYNSIIFLYLINYKTFNNKSLIDNDL